MHVIDTACSSSFVALHLAVNGLRGQECDIALCGGVNVIHHPYSSMLLTDMQALAPDGRCKTFDESADGYGRAEGCAVVVLKRLSDAERDGDTVLALVRGTAVRQDGESAGFTAPNGIAQEALMRAALANAMLEPGDIQYVEAHGTGTSLGDPIEMGVDRRGVRAIAQPAGPAPGRLAEDQHRAHGGRCRGRRRGQDGAAAALRHHFPAPQPGQAVHCASPGTPGRFAFPSDQSHGRPTSAEGW